MTEGKTKTNYVVITASGRVWGGMRITVETTYFDILDQIHLEFMTAGGSWDRPEMLLCNGKIAVASGLSDVAWKYGSELSEAQRAATSAVRGRFALAIEGAVQ